MLNKEQIAELVKVTIFLPPSGSHTAEEIEEYLFKQRKMIAERILGLE